MYSVLALSNQGDFPKSKRQRRPSKLFRALDAILVAAEFSPHMNLLGLGEIIKEIFQILKNLLNNYEKCFMHAPLRYAFTALSRSVFYL